MGEGSRTRKQRVTPARPAASDSVPTPLELALAVRITTLENRIAHLEKQMKVVMPPPPEPPAEPEPAARGRPRCPGCHLEVDSIARGRCPWCGFLFDAVAHLRRAARSRSG